MFSASAEYYDLIYSVFKDYAAECARIAALLRAHDARCRTVLDVACGTGEHARLLAADGFAVDGLDLDRAFVAIARRKHPAGRFFEADMRAFRLPNKYDAVLCLFSSIGYVRTLDAVAETFRCFREHLAPGGVVVVEPWFAPGVLDPQRTSQNVGESAGVRIVRSNRIEVEERLSRLFFDYEVTDRAGTRRFGETHELGLFTPDEMSDAFRSAGLQADFDSQGPMGRGLYIARAAGEWKPNAYASSDNSPRS